MIHSRVTRRHLSAIWNASPLPSLLLGADLVILGANDAYTQTTMTRPEELLGRRVFDVFPDNPAQDGSRSLADLRASFERVLKRLVSDTMPLTRYDMRNRAGVFVERHWELSNHPVLDQRRGDVLYLLHTATDKTESVLQARRIEQSTDIRQAVEEQRPAGRNKSSIDPPFAEDPLTVAIRTNFDNLTFREKEVLKFAIEGKANKDIASSLGISVRTVESFRTSILKKTLKANFLEISRAIHDLSRSDQA